MAVTIFIKNEKCPLYPVVLDDTEFQGTKVLDLKHKIAALEGTPESEQRLIFADKQLEDDFLLSHYGIHNEATIYMMLILRGGCCSGGPGDPGVGDKDGKNRSMEKLWWLF